MRINNIGYLFKEGIKGIFKHLCGIYLNGIVHWIFKSRHTHPVTAYSYALACDSLIDTVIFHISF